MNKKKILIIVIVLVIVIFSVIFAILSNNDEVKFKREYESLNNEKESVSIPQDNNVVYVDDDELIDILTSGTGIVFFGYSEDDTSRTIVEPLIEVAKKNETSIYYYNDYSICSEMKLEDGEIITTKEGSSVYDEILYILDDYLPIYEGLEDDAIKRLSFPCAIFLMGGKVVDIYYDFENIDLEDAFEDGVDKIYGTCDSSC